MEKNELSTIIQENCYKYIRIAGNGGSGKSTLANLLNVNNDFTIICTDDYLLDGETRSKMFLGSGERVTANCIEAYDFTKLTLLLNEMKLSKQSYIVEGIGAHFIESYFFDFSVFYCVSKTEEKIRRIARGEKFETQNQEEDFELRRAQFEERINVNLDDYDYKLYE